MKRILLLAVMLIPVTAACSSTPDLSPDDASNKIAEDLAAGNVEEAAETYDDIDGSDHHRQAVYATVYERAGSYYRKERFPEAIVMLRFLYERYPDAAAPRLALLYAHFLNRGRQETTPERDELKEVDTLIKEIRKADEHYPWWVDLAAAQAAIDAGKMNDARKEYALFKTKWDGQPGEARFYVEEFERYFRTKDGA